MKTICTLLFLLGISAGAFAQPTQTVRGKVLDSETNFPLVGAKVEVLSVDSVMLSRGLTNIDGEFTLLKVPVGKHQVRISLMTYDTKTQTVEVNSGKEVVLNLSLIHI
jgi:hypothetical protein